jgi:PadR family transcriptional regulator PadR
MKGDRLGEFEELTLLAVQALGEQTYGVPIQQFVEGAVKRNVSIGAIYAALERLERKGFVRSVVGPPSPTRGGRRKRLYEVTALGIRTAREIHQVRAEIWRAIEEGRRT